MMQSTLSELKVTEEELEQAHQYLESTRKNLARATEGLTEAQTSFKPGPDCWSIEEILEHVAIVQERVLGRVLEQLEAGDAPPEGRDHKRIDAIVMEQFPSCPDKFATPEAARPTHQWPASMTKVRVEENYRRLDEYLDSGADMRKHVLFAPPLKAVTKGEYELLDGYQWVLAAAAHTERHTRQILRWKDSPEYPR